ncbi:MAG: helix-turn-helix transcriptional regulator [Acidobacteria bacterium]|nr:helix-turn-helix transcriptional regulator [Acidobacteriota bacterium]MCH8972041.1 helix-turn-helix transcriptional regulator [Acidobacteriota bacterium]TDI51083.1 MAG: MerR family transcriptional regulator [Acidobacteriota bacterium]TDI53721.1 MAG: MerR family transcriptional regulator [Acidobacteriota bacterium]
MTETTRAVFVISVAAELAGMHPQTLRIYERKGLLDPFRTPGGTRRYSQEDIEQLQLIQELTSQGLNLEGVKRVLSLQEDNRRLKKKLDRLRDKLEEIEEASEKRLKDLERSFRHEIVLRSQVRPMYGQGK